MATELIDTLATGGFRTAIDATVLVAGALLTERVVARRLWPELRGALFATVVVRLWWPPGLEAMVAPRVGGPLGVASFPTPRSLDPTAGLPRFLLAVWAVGVGVVLFHRWRHRVPIGETDTKVIEISYRRKKG